MECYHRAEDLPPEWDTLCADNYALKRDFLALLEQGNPCCQRYYFFRCPDGIPDSIVVTYLCRRLNLFMLTPFDFFIDATLVHVPVSITRPGFVIGEKSEAKVLALIHSLAGFVIVLNTPVDWQLPGFSVTRTCAQLSLPVCWPSFSAYLSAMRNHYRYYYKKAMQKAESLHFRLLPDNSLFDEKMYALYEQVHHDSRIRLEKLNIEFFRASIWKIFVYERQGEPVGFIQLFENGGELVFEFVGLDYRYNQEYALYTNLLLKIMEYGITHGFKVIELGQTTEEMKLKLGGQYTTLQALLRHKHPVLNWFLGKFANFIAYKPFPAHFTVHKKEKEA